LPQYAAIYRDTYGYEPFLAFFEGDGGFVLQPFVRRALQGLPFLTSVDNADSYGDLTNPYGYGGPICRSSSPAAASDLYRRFSDVLDGWCEDHYIASEFTSLHPFMVNHQLSLVENVVSASHEKDVVFLDLQTSAAEIWNGLRKGHRSSINAARRSGAFVERVDADAANLRLFNEMYYVTMERRQAAARWFFPETYFANCVACLGSNRTSLFFASVGGHVESACFLIHDVGTAYYHFAATRAKYPELGVNNLMVYEVAIWAKKAGYVRFHLGGGVTGRLDDGLLRFKGGFSPKRAPLYTYFRIRDHREYEHLCELKRAHELKTAGVLSQSDFLPLYRR
jgi:hypothetical protein